MKIAFFAEIFLCSVFLLLIFSCGQKAVVREEKPVFKETETNESVKVEETVKIETNQVFTTEESIEISNKTKVLVIPFENMADQAAYPNGKIVNTILLNELYAFLYIVPSFDVPDKAELNGLNSKFLKQKDINSQDIYSNYHADIIIYGDYSLKGSKTDPTAQIHLNIWNKASGKIESHEYKTPIDADIFDAIDAMLSQIIRLTLNEEFKVAYLNIGNFKIGNEIYTLMINNKPAAKITNDNFTLNLKILPNAIYSVRLKNMADNRNVLNTTLILKPGETTNISYTAAFAENKLYDVVTNGNTAFIKYYLDDINRPLDIYGNTALILAVYDDNTDMIKTLIEAKADVNTADKDSNTALMWAVNKGITDVIKILIEAKADINATDKDGWTALMWPVKKGQTDLVKVLIKSKASVDIADKVGMTVLMKAAQIGHTDTAKALIEAKANLNTADNNGWTALMWAAQIGHADTVKALIEARANLNATDNNGWTALMWAAQNKHTDVVKTLIEAKADVNIADNNGYNALMYAANSTIAKLLKTAGTEQTIFSAAVLGDTAYIKKYSGDINAINKNGFTALMLAVQNKRTDAVNALIKAKADLNIANKNGETALSLALKKKYSDIIKLLENAGAKWQPFLSATTND